jgi:hypothetical protein
MQARLSSDNNGTALQMDTFNMDPMVLIGGKGCTRMRPEVAPARSWARFPNHWFHGIVRNFEG